MEPLFVLLLIMLIIVGFIIRACSVNPRAGANWFEIPQASNRAARRARR